MEKRIALEKRGLADDAITELILDNCRSVHIEGLTDSFTQLQILSLNNVGLVSLKSFPKLPRLLKLELSDNRISNGLSNLTGSPKLESLNLSGNRIKDFEELRPLKDLKCLEILDLFNNGVTSASNYREKIFELIPSLKFLDGFDKDDREGPSDGGQDEEDDEDEDEYDSSSEYDDENNYSLSEVYNDNLEDDSSDWSEEDDEAENDIDELTDEEEDDGKEEVVEEAAAAATAAATADETTEEARGKKRKHEDNDG